MQKQNVGFILNKITSYKIVFCNNKQYRLANDHVRFNAIGNDLNFCVSRNKILVTKWLLRSYVLF